MTCNSTFGKRMIHRPFRIRLAHWCRLGVLKVGLGVHVIARYRVRVTSFAKGARGEDLNIVLWDWGTTLPAKLVLIDDEGRLLQ